MPRLYRVILPVSNIEAIFDRAKSPPALRNASTPKIKKTFLARTNPSSFPPSRAALCIPPKRSTTHIDEAFFDNPTRWHLPQTNRIRLQFET
jgi:hypothetical protein